MNKHHLFSRQESERKKSKNTHKYFLVGTLATLLAACGQKAQTPDEKLYDKLIDLATNANITVTDGNAKVTLTDAGGTVVIEDGDNVVIGGKGADNITTGSGKDIVDGGAGNDKIVTGDGVDIVRAGAGADNVNTGAGHDIIVVIGINENGNTYTQSAIDNATANINLSSIITLADINNSGVAGAVSDVVAGDVIDGGADGATLVVYGEVDLTGVDLSNITIIEVHSTLIISVEKLKELIANGKFEGILGDDTSTIRIENNSNDPNAKVDLSGIDINKVNKLELGSNIEVKIDQGNANGLKEIIGQSGVKITIEKEAGATQQEVDLSELKFTGVDKLSLGADVKVTLSNKNVEGLKEIGAQNSGDKVEIKLEAKAGEEEIDLSKLKLDNIEKLELSNDVKVTLNQDNIDALKQVAAESESGNVEIKLEKTDGQSEVDLTGLDIKDVDKLEVGAGIDLKVDKGSLDGLGEIGKENANDEDFSLKVEQDDDQTGEVDLSKITISGVDKLQVADDVVVVVEQELIDELDEVSGEGAVQSETQGETLDLGDNGNIQVATDNGGGNVTFTNIASVAENNTAVDYGTLNGVDPSAATFAISGTDSAKFSIDANGILVFISAPDFETPTDIASGTDTAGDNVYSITLDVTENAVTTNHNLTISVTDANDAPVFTSNALTTANVAENTSTPTALSLIAATDQDAADSITYSLAGEDAAFFTIDAITAEVSFIGGQDFEAPADQTPDNVYKVSVVATDTGGASASRDIEVTVTNVNEAPVFNDTSTVISLVDEGQTAVQTVAATDPENDAISYSLSGTDSALFNIDGLTGVITFKAAPDFETFADLGTVDGIYNVTVTADDGNGQTSTRDVNIVPTNVNEAPTFASADTNVVLNVDENTTAVGSDVATDVDAGDTLTYSIGGTDGAFFNATASGGIEFKVAPNYETDQKTYDITLIATDTDGLSDSRSFTVNVTDVNETPSFASDDQLVVSVGQYQTDSAPVADVNASDPDAGETLVYTLTGTDSGLFNISATGEVSFKVATPFQENSSNTYEVTAVVTDGGNLTDTRDVEITVTDQNTAPVFTANLPTEVTLNENIDVVGTFGATDFDPTDIVTYTLTGDDESLFQVNALGEVSFISTPDYENPANANHTYNFTINAADDALSAEHSVTVTVENVAETPAVYVSAYAPHIGGQQGLRDSGEYQTRSTALSNGNSVVTFSSWHHEHQQDHIWAQLLDQNGNKIGVAIQISDDNNPDNHQLRSEVTALSGGGFAVIWSQSDNNSGGYYARLYDNAGSSTSDEITILETDFQGSRNPYVEVTADGNLIFVMSKRTTDGNGDDTGSVVAKTYNIANDTLGAEFILPNLVHGDNSQAHEHIEDVLILDSGEILLVFGSSDKAGVQKLAVSGGTISTVGNRIEVSTGEENNGQWIKAAQLDNGNYVVTWLLDLTDRSVDENDPAFEEIQEIKYQVFQSDGTPVSEILNVDPADPAFISGPQITAINGGGFAIVFVTNNIGQEGKLLQIQEFLADGTPAGNSVIINSQSDGDASTLYPTSLSVLDGDKLLVSWFGRHEVDFHEGHYQVIDFNTGSGTVFQMPANGITPFPTDAMATAPDDETLEMTISNVPLGISFFNPNNNTSTPVGNYTPDANGTTQTVIIQGDDITDLHIFNPAGDSTFTLVISVVATDSNGGTASKNFTLNVNVIDYGVAPILDMPEIINVVENHTEVATIIFSDADTADTHTFALTGENADQFTVDFDGVISFNSPPDADSIDDHQFRFNIIVTDNKGNSDQQEVRVRLADTQEAPVIDTDEDNFTVEEGTQGNFTHINILGNNGGVRFSLKGADAGLFIIDRHDGDLSFAVRPDFENKLDADFDNIYELTVVATHEYTGLSDEFDVTVDVTDNTNELAFNAPVLTSPTFDQVLAAPIANVENIYEHDGDITVLSNGRIVVVWSEEDVADGVQHTPDRVYFKVYAADGSTVLTPRTAIGVASGDQGQLVPRVVADSSDGFFVAIHHGEQDAGNAQFIGIQFTDAGGNSYTGGSFINLSVANLYTTELFSGVMDIEQLSGGNFVVSYQTEYHNVTVNTVDATGTIISTFDVAHNQDAQLNDTNERTSIVEVLDDGSGFVVAWMRRDNDGDVQVIIVERYDNNGVAIAGTTQELSLPVNPGDRIVNNDPDVAALGGDKYVVTWQADVDEEQPRVVMAQIMDANGTVGSAFQVSTGDESGTNPKAIKLLGVDGGMLIVWEDNGAIHGQQYSTAGDKIGDNFAIASQPLSGGAQNIELVALQNGGFAVKWGEARHTDNPDNENNGYDGDTYIKIYNLSNAPTWSHNDWQTIPVPIGFSVDPANIDYVELTVLGAPDEARFEVRNRDDHNNHAHDQHRDGDPWIFEPSDIADLAVRFGNNFEGSATLTYIFSAIGTDGSSISSTAIVVSYDINNVNNAPHYHDDFGSRYLELFEGETVLTDEGNVIVKEGFDHDGDTYTMSLEGPDGYLFGLGADGSIFFKAAPDFEDSEAANTDEPNIYKFILVLTDEHGAQDRRDYEVEVKNRDNDELTGLTLTGTPNSGNDGEFIAFNLTLSDAPANAHIDDIVIFGTEGYEFNAGETLGGGIWKIPADAIATLQVKSTDNADGNHTFHFEVRYIDEATGGATRLYQPIEVTFTNIDYDPVFELASSTFHVNPTDLFIKGLKASDADGDALSFTLTGTNAALFDYDGATGNISFKTGSEPTDANAGTTYNLVVTASDGVNDTDQVFAIVVDPTPAQQVSIDFKSNLTALHQQQLTFNEDDNNQQRSHNVLFVDGSTGLIVWQQDNKILAQKYNPFNVGAIGEISELANDAFSPTVAVTPTGQAVVLWHTYDGDNDGIFAAFIDPNGVNGPTVGNSIRVNEDISGPSRDPQVAVLSDSASGVVIWQQGVDSDKNIMGRYLSQQPDGTYDGNSFLINANTTGTQTDYHITALDNGTVVVTWTSFGGQDGDGAGIYMQQFGADQNGDFVPLLGGDIRVADNILGDQQDSDVTAVNGGFIVTWRDAFNWGDIHLKMYNDDGTPKGPDAEMLVSADFEDLGEWRPEILGLNNGQFIVVWHQNRYDEATDKDYDMIVGQRFNDDGTRFGAEFTVDEFERGVKDEWFGDIKLNLYPSDNINAFSISYVHGERDNGNEVEHIFSKEYGQLSVVKLDKLETLESPFSSDIDDAYTATIVISDLPDVTKITLTTIDPISGIITAINPEANGDYILTKEQYENLHFTATDLSSGTETVSISITTFAPNGQSSNANFQFTLFVGVSSTVDDSHVINDQNQLDIITGTDEIDTFVIAGHQSAFKLTWFGHDIALSDIGETRLELLHGIEQIQFDNGTFTLEQLDILDQGGQIIDPNSDTMINVFRYVDYDPLDLL